MKIAWLALGTYALTFNADEAKDRPVTKVIQLLKDMQTQLQKEADLDQDTYDQLSCWCNANNRDKTQTIKEAEQLILQLRSEIEEHKSNAVRLEVEIENLAKEIAKNEQSLGQATTMREKQHEDFVAEEKDLVESISALKSAVVVLSKHHKKPEAMLMEVKGLLKHVNMHHDVLEQAITPREKRMLTSFLASAQAPEYAPQSGEIFGILKNMKDTFQTNLSSAQTEETDNKKAFQELKDAKTKELNAGKLQHSQKKEQYASANQKAAQASQDIEDTEASLSEDNTFLIEVKKTCSTTDAEFAERTKTRHEEMGAVAEALAVLSQDDAHDLFSKTLNFMQIRKQSVQKKKGSGREEAAKVLMAVHSPRLATLSASVKKDSFARVFEAIDKMVEQLLKEKDDEAKHRDWCITELNTNEKETTRAQRNKEQAEVKIADLTGSIVSLTSESAVLETEISELQTQLKRAGEDREKENRDFQVIIADQRQTQKLLEQAVTVLQNFYAQKTSFIEVHQEPPSSLKGAPAPKGFESYRKNQGGAGGVLVMLEKIIGDAKRMEAEAIQGEADAQKSYESLVKRTNSSISIKSKGIDNKKAEKGQAEVDKTEKKDEFDSYQVTLEQLSSAAADAHKSCDFITKNFEVRQTARDEEVEALRQAKAILSGSNFQPSFLQRQ